MKTKIEVVAGYGSQRNECELLISNEYIKGLSSEEYICLKIGKYKILRYKNGKVKSITLTLKAR